MKNTIKYKIGVSKFVLMFLAGIMWTSVGILLLFISLSFLDSLSKSTSIINAGIGIGMALIMNYFVFQQLVDKNLKRILSMGEKNVIISFISWKTYLIIPVMIIVAVSLRRSNIPDQYLYILYIGIGFAKLLAGLKHILALVNELYNKP